MKMVFPSKIRIVPNCKLAKLTPNHTDDEYQKMMNGGNSGVIEKRNHKKHGRVITKYTIINAEGYSNTDPLISADYDVLSVCISEIEAGNMATTPAIILRGLTGRTKAEIGGTSNGAVNKDQRAAILNSIEKLMSTIITIDATETNKALGYNDGKAEIITDTILPCHYKTEKINGQIVDDTIIFDRQSPIFKFADQRNQIIRYDVSLLDVPNQNNTPLVINLKNQVIIRVLECKNHKMTPTITLDDIFKKCRISDKSKRVKQSARETIDKFLTHLQSKGVIKSFEWTKKGNKFYSVKFTF